jgi:D-mannonate dehydratase
MTDSPWARQIDMHKAMVAYKDAGFRGPFMMDHTPNVTGAAGKEGMAYAIGYIRALVQVV